MIKGFYCFVILYTLWIGFSYLFLNTSYFFQLNGFYLDLSIYFSVIFFVLIASIKTAIFMIYENSFLEKTPTLRFIYILLSLAIWIGIFLFVRITGNKSDNLFIIGSANLVVFSILCGTWLASAIKRPAELVPVCVIMALADLLSVAKGPTKEIVEAVENYYKSGMLEITPFGDFLLVKIASLGFDRILPVFGVSDWIIVSFLSATAFKFRMDDNIGRKSLKYMNENKRLFFYFPITAFYLAFTVILAQSLHFPIPALLIIAPCFLVFILIRYPESRRLNKKEWNLLFLFSSIMLAIFFIRLLFLQRNAL
ncbi:MAG: hypothetical protein HQK76_16590 [Desulfobacterales bacterium]|nr:hypothetical protein [Desulfobacterales bacterium]